MLLDKIRRKYTPSKKKIWKDYIFRRYTCNSLSWCYTWVITWTRFKPNVTACWPNCISNWAIQQGTKHSTGIVDILTIIYQRHLMTCSHRQCSREPREIFSHRNKSWITVINGDSFLISYFYVLTLTFFILVHCYCFKYKTGDLFSCLFITNIMYSCILYYQELPQCNIVICLWISALLCTCLCVSVI